MEKLNWKCAAPTPHSLGLDCISNSKGRGRSESAVRQAVVEQRCSCSLLTESCNWSKEHRAIEVLLWVLSHWRVLVTVTGGRLTMAGCQMPTQLLSHSLSSTGWGKKIRSKAHGLR